MLSTTLDRTFAGLPSVVSSERRIAQRLVVHVYGGGQCQTDLNQTKSQDQIFHVSQVERKRVFVHVNCLKRSLQRDKNDAHVTDN